MSAEAIEAAAPPSGSGEYEIIHLGGEAAAVVPLHKLRRLMALERSATPEALEEAEADAQSAAMDEWEAAGRPGAVSHEELMAEILGGGE